jgi:hypothetical protein
MITTTSATTPIWKKNKLLKLLKNHWFKLPKTKKKTQKRKKKKKKHDILQLIPDMFEEQVYTKRRRRRSKVQRAGCKQA